MRTTRSRREVLAALAGCTAALIDPRAVLAALAARQTCHGTQMPGTLAGTLPLFRPGAPVQPFGVKFGGPGLDARLVTDLSVLQPDRLITPTHLAYIRTECPPQVSSRAGTWAVRTAGTPAAVGSLPIHDLRRAARPMGAHLFECAGNNNPANFGLLSVAEWEGVPLGKVVAALRPPPHATGVLVTGLDHEGQASATSVGGASWVFPIAALDRLGAFLAVGINGEPLTPDHGHPVRLVVPGWYACTWIKWVEEIRLVGDDEPATGQMKEFAGRTHQSGRHDLARDYAPPVIEAAAMPVRVEKWRGPAGIEYRIVGIVWGGSEPAARLAIRFGAGDPWKPFAVCPAPTTHQVWSLWDYRWKPPAPGVYELALRIGRDGVAQRRLDAGFYARQVRIDEV
jgi:DMSO/TMAO reductase YedYZ molybdopterin-dependent catalytic subunit